nr:DEAD/DEAH box helicase [Corynebacterium cystitidis]
MIPSKSAIRTGVEHGFIDKALQASDIFNPLLVVNNGENTMQKAISEELSTAESFVFSVAFITPGGLGALKEALVGFRGTGKIITSDYQDFNEPAAFEELLKLPGVETFVFTQKPHHAKGYIFRRRDYVTSIVGSSNLTRDALIKNSEWNLRFSTHNDGDITDQLNGAIDAHLDGAERLTPEWIKEYEARRVPPPPQFDPELLETLSEKPAEEVIKPNAMQTEALEQLQLVLDNGEKRALIISATGTGKTILSALATQMYRPERMLFVVHREQILQKAASEFKRVIGCEDADIGFFVGSRRQLECTYVFASIQSLSRPETLARISPKEFDLIIVDEVHRSGAETYLRVLNHFRPDFLLGLTATPERTDGFNIFELFDHNVPYEIRLRAALESHMLVPFDYYGVSDYQSGGKGVPGDDSSLSELIDENRVEYIVEILERYGFSRGVKGLFFCSRNEEALKLSEALNRRLVFDKPLRTVALSGDDSIQRREEVIAQLEAGDIDYILTVDIFNEGIDIPPVNQVVMLRATQSSIIFTQQLGRGLRISEGKKSLRVIDFIGNYANNYLIPIALTGDRSGVKESVRETMRKANRSHFAGMSTISFDQVATRRILESLEKVNLLDKRQAKESIRNLQHRLGGIPRLIDFEHHESTNPALLASRWGNYWSLLHSLKFVDQKPLEKENAFLDFLHGEILNGKRPQEALVIRELLTNPKLPTEDIASMLAAGGYRINNEAIQSISRVLNLSFFTKLQQKKYGNLPVATVDSDGNWQLGEDFAALYNSYTPSERFNPKSFRDHIDDFIETTLLLNRKHYDKSGTLVIGKTYTRRDACRLLNWASNHESTVYGYKTDKQTMTCPIFVTYHKDADVEASVNYGDKFIDQSTMHWFTRNNRTLESKELEPILSNAADLHLFVMREDADDGDFYYLGQVEADNAKQTTMSGKQGDELDVVTTDLNLKVPIPQELFAALTAPKTEAIPL